HGQRVSVPYRPAPQLRHRAHGDGRPAALLLGHADRAAPRVVHDGDGRDVHLHRLLGPDSPASPPPARVEPLDLRAVPRRHRPDGRHGYRRRALGRGYSFTLPRRSALPTTDTELRLIAAAAIIGL